MRDHLLSCCLVLALLGCGDQSVAATLGEQGRVEFQFRRSCFFGCPLEQPLLKGARETIDVDGAGDDEDVQVSVSDRDVLDFAVERECVCRRSSESGGGLQIAEDASCQSPRKKHCDNMILVEALKVGESFVELHDEDGDLIDRAEVFVRKADSALFEAIYPDRLGSFEGTEFELSSDESIDVEVTLYDAEGVELLAPEGVHWAMADPDVAIVNAWLIGRGEQVDAGLGVSVEGVGKGATELSVDVPGLEATVDIIVD